MHMFPSGQQSDAAGDSPQRIVVTGAAGFIGRYVVQQALARGWEVLALGRGPAPLAPPAGLHYLREDEDAPPTLPDDWQGRPFALVHLAWDTSRTPSYAVHLHCVQRLAARLEAHRDQGLTLVVGLGSAEEYGNRAGTLHAEDTPLGPLTPYGFGKRMASELLAAWSARTSVSAMWLCPLLVYGPGQAGNMALPYALRQAVRGQRAQFSDGRQQRDLVYVADVAAAILAAVERRPSGFHRLTLGTGRAVPLRKAINAIAQQFGVAEKFELGAIARRPGEPAVQQADAAAALELLGWRAETEWSTGIAALCASARDQSVHTALLGQGSSERTWLPHVPQPDASRSPAPPAPHLPLSTPTLPTILLNESV